VANASPWSSSWSRNPRLYLAACDRSRSVAAEAADLEATAALPSFGKGPVSLRWLYLHMIEETAQHRGHLDLLLDAIRRM
jgi:hypothetical protein